MPTRKQKPKQRPAQKSKKSLGRKPFKFTKENMRAPVPAKKKPAARETKDVKRSEIRTTKPQPTATVYPKG